MSITATSYTVEKFEVGDYDLKLGVSQLKYYESILSPAISFEATIVDTDGVLSGGRGGSGLFGGELCKIKINGPTGPLDFSKVNLYLRKITSGLTDSTTSIFILTITTETALKNETSRCCQRYDGRISDIVYKIAGETFLSKKDSRFFVETTGNNYSFLGNARKPFHTLTWLARRSIQEKGSGKSNSLGSAGFFFYEDRDGHKFVSVDSLISKVNQEKSFVQEYVQSEFSDTNTQNQFNILSYSIDSNYDLLENLRTGMFSNINYYWDAFHHTTKCYQYNLKDNYSDKMKTLVKSASPYNIPEGLDENPSRIMFSVLDNGTLQKDGKVPDNTYPQDQTKYQAQAIVRYNLIFSQTVSITIPANVTLKVGDVIKCTFLQPNGGKDKARSGNYLIADISHQFGSGSAYSGLRLIRDSYGDLN